MHGSVVQSVTVTVVEEDDEPRLVEGMAVVDEAGSVQKGGW